jgi:hypothetical protein
MFEWATKTSFFVMLQVDFDVSETTSGIPARFYVYTSNKKTNFEPRMEAWFWLTSFSA